MEQIKYILYSILILTGAALTYAVMEPVLFSRPPAVAESESGSRPAKAAAPVAVKNTAGKNLFSANCGTCHSLTKALTGPALAKVEERGPWTRRENLLKWVSNPGAFIATNPYAKELSVQFNGQVMPSFPQLSKQEKNQIFDYIKEASLQALPVVP